MVDSITDRGNVIGTSAIEFNVYNFVAPPEEFIRDGEDKINYMRSARLDFIPNPTASQAQQVNFVRSMNEALNEENLATVEDAVVAIAAAQKLGLVSLAPDIISDSLQGALRTLILHLFKI